jgi:hypothetical protein
MSVNEWGTLKEPTRPVPPADEPTAAEKRAGRASAGRWDEDLGRYGADRWNLPGYGEKGPKCEEWYAEAVCDECGHLQLGTHNCGRRSCSNCWGIWAREAGVRATERLQSFREVQPKDYRRQAAHAVVSPPEGEVMNEREFYDGRSRAADIAREKGFRGFAVIPHPWRVREEAKRAYRIEDPDVGLWVWLRRELPESKLREMIYWSPHYHVVGATTAEMEPGDESDEWLYEFIRSFGRYESKHDTESHEEVYGAFRYLLSHTGFPEESTKQSVTWYGDLANAVFVEEAAQDYQIQKPSEGVRSVIRREIEAIAGPTDGDESDGEAAGGEDGDEVGECPEEDCDGLLIDVFDVEAYLRHNEPPPDAAERMKIAMEWRLGRREPPPGLKRPQTEEQAREAFGALLP